MRRAAMAVAVGVLGCGGAGAEGLQARAPVDFRIVIPVVVHATQIAQARQLEIGGDDLARGYVDLDDATTVSLTSNARGGYSLSAVFDSSIVARVVVRLQGQSLTFTGGFSSAPVASSRLARAVLGVGYRLYLNPGVQPGRYRWPVALAFRAAA